MIAFIVEILFFGFCGWLGHVVVKLVTLGKVDLEYGDSSESVITEWIGVGVLLAIAMLISFFINTNREQSSAMLIPVSILIRAEDPDEDEQPMLRTSMTKANKSWRTNRL